MTEPKNSLPADHAEEWYLEGYDKVGEIGGYVIRHRNETDWLFFPSKWRQEPPKEIADILAKLNATLISSQAEEIEKLRAELTRINDVWMKPTQELLDNEDKAKQFEALQSDIERITKERDMFRRQADAAERDLNETLTRAEAAESSLASMTAERDQLRKVLARLNPNDVMRATREVLALSDHQGEDTWFMRPKA